MVPSGLFPVLLFITGATMGNALVRNDPFSVALGLVGGFVGLATVFSMAAFVQYMSFIALIATLPALVGGLAFPALTRRVGEWCRLSVQQQ